MSWRHATRTRCGALAIAVAMGGLVPAGSVRADEPFTTAPDDGGDPAPDEVVENPPPETGDVEGTLVAVGAPPVPTVPPVDETPQVAVGEPPVPPADETPQVAVGQPPAPPATLFETVGAALDLVADCL